MSRRRKTQEPAPHLRAIQSAYDQLQTLKYGLAALVLVCGVLGSFLAQPGTSSRNLVFMLAIISTSLLTFAFTMRNTLVLPALQELRRSPQDTAILARWRRANIIVLSLCESVGVMGFVLQMLGAARLIPLAMYVIAISYLFLLAPKKP